MDDFEKNDKKKENKKKEFRIRLIDIIIVIAIIILIGILVKHSNERKNNYGLQFPELKFALEKSHVIN